MARVQQLSRKLAAEGLPREGLLKRTARKRVAETIYASPTEQVPGKKPAGKTRASAAEEVEKPLRPQSHPHAKMFQKIHRYQQRSGLVISLVGFRRLMKEACDLKSNLYFQSPALLPLQEATEAHLLRLYEDWNQCALHAKRASVRPSDVHLVRCLRGDRA